MFKTRNNYGDKGVCRLCKMEQESTEHLGECNQVYAEKVTELEIKSEKEECEKKVIARFKAVKEKLDKTEEGL